MFKNQNWLFLVRGNTCSWEMNLKSQTNISLANYCCIMKFINLETTKGIETVLQTVQSVKSSVQVDEALWSTLSLPTLCQLTNLICPGTARPGIKVLGTFFRFWKAFFSVFQPSVFFHCRYKRIIYRMLPNSTDKIRGI